MPASKQNINLTQIPFPLLSGLRGLGVYVAALDSEREPALPYWVENVMPIQQGFASTRTEELVSADVVPEDAISDNSDNTDITLVYNSVGEVTYGLVSDTKFLIYEQRLGTWKTLLDTSSIDRKFSIFYLKGTTWVFHKSSGLYKFGATFSDFTVQPIDALANFEPNAAGNVNSMTSVLSYIVAVTDNEVYWSSSLDELEFNPVADPTAGATKVLSLKGKIQLVLPLAQGFIIYTTSNAIVATYSNNPNNPWVFREVANSSGVFRPNHVTYQDNLPFHYVWSSNGLLQVTTQGATPVFPEVTDFISGDTIERYNEVTKTIEVEIGTPLSTKFTFLTSRYFAISYGLDAKVKEFILIYDAVLQRWGKVAIKHKAVFNFVPPKLSGGVAFNDLASSTFTELEAVRFSDLAQRVSEGSFAAGSFAVLKEDNSVVKVEWTENADRGNGRIIFGNIALTRSRITDLNEITLSGIYDQANINIEVRSLRYNPKWTPTFYVEGNDWFVTSTSGKEHEIKVEGGFALATIINKLNHSGVE